MYSVSYEDRKEKVITTTYHSLDRLRSFDSLEFILFHIMFHIDHVTLNYAYILSFSVDFPFLEDTAKQKKEL